MIFTSNKIEVRYSPISGRGVFTKTKIEKGEVIESCHFLILEKKFIDLDKKLQEYVFSWPKNSSNAKSAIVFGFGSIYNHSRDNNVDWETDEKNNLFRFFAIKPIENGEEIFINYGLAYEQIVKTIN
jgi:SET domain-containing protein